MKTIKIHVQANVHLSSILYSRATVRKRGRAVKQLMIPGMKKMQMARSQESCCCAKNILANTLNRKAGHRISFYAQSLTGCTCSEVYLLFWKPFCISRLEKQQIGNVKTSIISSTALNTHNQDHLFLTRSTIYSGFYPEKITFSFHWVILPAWNFKNYPFVLSFAWIILEFRWKGSNYSACTRWQQRALIFHQQPKSRKQENLEIFSCGCVPQPEVHVQ